MPADDPLPRDVFLEVNRLRHHLLEWGRSGPTVLLLHGLMEHAHAWDFVAPRLAAAGLHVYALDWRGHGDSEWIGRGGYYHFADYTADLADLVRALGGKVALVGHSMGGNAAVTFAGTEPDRVARLAVIEGLGPPDTAPTAAAERYAQWIIDLERSRTNPPRSTTVAAAAKRLAERFLFSPEVARHMAIHGTRAADDSAASTPAGDSTIASTASADDASARRLWKFDPLHRTRSPQPFYVDQARGFWRRITCPVLYIDGTRSFLSAAATELAARVDELGARHVTIEGATHHPHLEHPDEVTQLLLEFLAPA